MTETVIAGIAALLIGPGINYLRKNGERGNIKPYRDLPAMLAGFLVLAVGLGGLVWDRCVLGSGDIWSVWLFLIVLGFIVLTGFDPRSLLPKRNGDT